MCFQYNDQAISDYLPTQANHISCQQFSNTELGGGMVIKYHHGKYDVGKSQLHNWIFFQRVAKIYGQYTSHLH